MIVKPKNYVKKMGRKNIAAKTEEQAFEIYRKRFGLSDDVELIVEGSDDGARSSDTGLVEGHPRFDDFGSGRSGGVGDSPDGRDTAG